jgi:protein-tyrosine phosphatase
VIVAHPERIDYLTYQDLRQLKAEGALFQVSSSHLLPWKMDRASRISKRLLKNGLVDFVASDAHKIDTLMTMRQSYHYVQKKLGKEKANEIFIDNPTKILTKTA